jgi:hypothetical protein
MGCGVAIILFLGGIVLGKWVILNDQTKKSAQIQNLSKKQITFKNIIILLGLSALFGTIFLFVLLFTTGMIVSAALVGPLLGYLLALMIVFRKTGNWKKKTINLRDLFSGIILGTGIFTCFALIANNFTSIFPWTRTGYVILFGALLLPFLYFDECFMRQWIQKEITQRITQQSEQIITPDQVSFRDRLKIYLQTMGFGISTKFIAAIFPFIFMIYLIGNSFPLMILVFLLIALFLKEGIGVIWYHFSNRIWINVITFLILFSNIVVAASPIIAPLGINF